MFHSVYRPFPFFFSFNATAPTQIYTLSLHDALPISVQSRSHHGTVIIVSHCPCAGYGHGAASRARPSVPDRKSTRLNSSHQIISYAVFCLKKKNPKYPYPKYNGKPSRNDSTQVTLSL